MSVTGHGPDEQRACQFSWDSVDRDERIRFTFKNKTSARIIGEG
jgi:hypothetical protein